MKATIDSFVNAKKLALIGASADPAKWSYQLGREIAGRGYEVLPVNPKRAEIEGRRCYASPSELPAGVENAIIAVRPAAAEAAVASIAGSGIKRVWFQTGAGGGSSTPAAIAAARKAGLEVVHGLCPMMFYGEGFHKFHFKLRKFFGGVPKDYRE